jgi:hypothetical protein
MSAADTNIPRPDGVYPVFIVYRRPMDYADQLIQAFGGGNVQCEYTHCELYLPDEGVTFTIFKGGTMQKSAMLPMLYTRMPDRFAWHLLPLNHDEYLGLLHWNNTQLASHCPYNFRDLIWQVVPRGISNSFVHDLEPTSRIQRIFCSQAIILALRDSSQTECARQILRDFVCSINSRLATPSDLARLTTHFLGVPPRTSVVPSTLEEVNAHLQEAVFNPASLFSDPNSCATQAIHQLRR